ncbi:MAG: TRAP transporter substrate-binding protein [Enterocloster citroniae]|nr:TRAP transporter substrate-binding protein [Enterocloster citroniae]
MKKKITALFLASVMAVSVLGGCGSGGAKTPPADGQEAAADNKGADSKETDGKGADSVQAADEKDAQGSPADAGASGGEKITLKLAMTNGNEITGPTAQIFVDYLQERIPRLTVEQYINGELYTNAEELQAALSEGIVDITLEGDMAMSWASPEWIGWTSIPFAFSSKEQAVKFFTGDAGKEINQKLISDFNMRFLDSTVGARGGRMITANKKVTKPDDLKGLKMRTPNVIGTVASWEALGATVITVPWGDLFNALQTGVVDAEENPYLEIKSGGFYQVQKYIMETNHQIGPQVIWFNEASYQKFTPEEQAIIQEANKAAFDHYTSASEENDRNIKKELTDAGNIIIPAEEIDMEAFRQIILDKVVKSDTVKDYKEGGWDYIQSLAE